MKIKMKHKTKGRVFAILYIVSFIVIAYLLYRSLPDGCGWFKY